MELLQHMDITNAERTGYAKGHEPVYFGKCHNCGQSLYVGDNVIEREGKKVYCEDCLTDETA